MEGIKVINSETFNFKERDVGPYQPKDSECMSAQRWVTFISMVSGCLRKVLWMEHFAEGSTLSIQCKGTHSVRVRDE
jgi:hypothetical protein